jgi:dipeptidyl-peptidase-4
MIIPKDAMHHVRDWFGWALVLMLIPFSLAAQDRFKLMPGYERYQKMNRELPTALKSGAVSVTWKEDGRSFDYRKDGKTFHTELAPYHVSELPAATNASPSPATNRNERVPRSGSSRRPRPEAPERGRQFTSAASPNGKFKAAYRDRNVWLTETNNTNATAVTTDGSDKTRVKSGSANWVYGEELYQTTAMWWSSNSAKLAFYRFDESHCADYYLTLDETKFHNKLDVEPYMKVGATNPLVDIFIHDPATKKSVRVDVRDGQPFDNAVVGHYVYGISWTADSQALLFHRTNRRQNIMEFCAADPETGKTRVIVREEWPASWTENLPTIHWLKDRHRFIWTSERSGWKNFYLYAVDGGLLAKLTDHQFEVGAVSRVDEAAGMLYYTARSGDNPLKLQLHRVGLDGHDDRRLTNPAFHHTIDVAPRGGHFVDIAETHDKPPTTTLRDPDGKMVAEIGKSDLTRFKQLGLKPVELLTFKAADDRTDLYGMLHFPSGFRPQKKYPLLVSVYAGPETVGARESFTLPNALTELGFLVATFDSRSASGRGKHFLDAIYQKLGRVEIDDQAAGVRSLWERRYVDRRRVGIFGTSYGGTASAMCLLRYPDVFKAACANSAVTDYRNYDTIYAERYMWIPEENREGFEAGSLMTHAKNLSGRLMVYYGTADNNVHPANSLQLIAALQKAGKSFEVQVGPDLGHTSVNRERMMEFFIENLVLK